ncbi:hypothetical protein CWE22_10025 [Pseudidiomarina aestuarii]|uniref:Resolvase/invertase-type recombinase catalytic domain-containing protein n=1 Tax=Pseudidiomarina aestuarii TaxID=624146 RepID=A0A7Z6ZSU3_9GAMM|nr:recombinase family protein [Pseudidiomarina aestuarii]RUO39619.1 hypothetical protein CWE22_10025 [Pseudidiomarina aestuarii]
MYKIGYIRVSSVDQNTERQLEGMELNKFYVDKCSGSTTERPQLIELLKDVREGDIVYVHSIDRMARNLEDLLSLIKQFNEKDTTLHFVKEDLKFKGSGDDASQKLMLSIMGAVAEFERAIILERQREGIARAKQRGVYKGRKKSVDRDKVLELHQQGVKKMQIAKKLGIGRATVYRILEEQAEA